MNLPKLIKIHGFNILLRTVDYDIAEIRAVVNAGAYHETKETYGVAHCLEHLLFKGTHTKSESELGIALAELGYSNANTSNKKTVYYIETLSEKLCEAFDVLSDMLFNSKLDETAFKTEKNVILEELMASQEDPLSYFNNEVALHIFGEEYGHNVLGTKQTLKKLTLPNVLAFQEKYYTKENIVFAVLGRKEDIEKFLSHFIKWSVHDGAKVPLGQLNEIKKPKFNWQDVKIEYPSKQAIVQLVHHYNAPEQIIKQKQAKIFALFNNILGQGAYSILFEELRNKHGLCYEVYSDGDFHNSLQVQMLQTNKKNIDKATILIKEIDKRICQEGFEETALRVGKSNYLFNLGRYLSDIESMNEYSASFFLMPFDEMVAELQIEQAKEIVMAITNDDIIQYANLVFNSYPLNIIQQTK